ncbi:methyl-accepting chemotaxis protein [Candidatus Galacturonibacter soehngenii]|uniref:methyl-accepting chemotaxis protein n=1 Tax=Candidatus Galacturonatibacter soehngenii TaxID=2307010 RepID=UPI001FA99AD7|nr:methyl-accepting chemotaxis protein [Candidatus Galacturonibacter soehngenii]
MNTIEEYVDAFIKISPYVQTLYEGEVSVAITDLEKFIYTNYTSKLDLKAKEGDAIPKGGAIKEAIDTGREVVKEVPSHVYGLPFKSYAVPIKNDNQVIGVIVFGKSLEKKKKLNAVSEEVVTSLNEISAALNTVSQGVQSLALMNNDLMEQSTNTKNQMEEIKNVVQVVESIASQTNLLGLNASIEAARAGENGRGFSIVAQEIRNLSNSSSESMKKIRAVIQSITSSTQIINDRITEFNDVSQNQSASLEEITASLEEISNTSKILDDLSNKL